jgi:hypothetical protein
MSLGDVVKYLLDIAGAPLMLTATIEAIQKEGEGYPNQDDVTTRKDAWTEG